MLDFNLFENHFFYDYGGVFTLNISLDPTKLLEIIEWIHEGIN
jgi:hypothetical protein